MWAKRAHLRDTRDSGDMKSENKPQSVDAPDAIVEVSIAPELDLLRSTSFVLATLRVILLRPSGIVLDN